ncbi:MAG: glycosyltransferase family 4 protein [Ignavibacteriales bacterium]|nr:glycosyltransferase family 4 protein [Ignavibacteriales bacterium]
MKILFVTNTIGAAARGGLFIQATKTAEYLKANNIEVTLHNAWEHIHLTQFDAVHIFGAGIGTYHFAREIHKRNIPFILSPVHFSSHSVKKIRMALNVQSSFRKIISGTWTDIGIVEEMCKWATGIVPNTSDEAKLLTEGLKIPKEKIHIVPNGVEERFATATPDEWKEKFGTENFVLNVGYWGKRKNTLPLIRALKKLSLPAVLIGGYANDEYGKLCIQELADAKNIHTLDSLEHDSSLLASCYAAAKVFVLPSLFETPGISALEAGLAGANIAITKFGGTEEYFLAHASYLDPHSEESIAETILSTFQKEKTTALREHILQNFMWESVAKKTEEAYKHFL